MQGLAAKFKGKKKKDEKEMEEEEEKAAAEENGLTSEDGDEEEEEDEDEEEEEEEEDEEDDDDAVAGPAVEGSYDAAEWEHLEVNISNFRRYTWLGGRSIHLTRCQKRKRSCLNIFTGTSRIYLVSFSCVQSTKYKLLFCPGTHLRRLIWRPSSNRSSLTTSQLLETLTPSSRFTK